MRSFGLILLSVMSLIAKDYEPNWESLDSRPTPQWYKDAKFGIFIHWGLYSVPAWGPRGSYAEWYLNGLNSGDSTRLKYHEEKYGQDFPYRDFIKLFKSEKYEPEKWAELFKESGAKYIVLTSKHHDGFCLWPSKESDGYNSVEGAAKRDLLGDLNTAVKKSGLKSGFYYSLYEWDHQDYPTNIPKYVNDHMLPQFKDAVQRYKPSIIFSDGEWDQDSQKWRSEEFLAWLYNESSAPQDVVVNDRWGGETRFKHGGYYSTEYDPNSGSVNEEFIQQGWEECRGIGRSFGYNRNERPEDYNTSEELIRLLVDIVSRGGNLLLNIGPKADGTIPKIMVDRLKDIGVWLDKNGEAIYKTTVNRITQSNNGKVKYTLSKDCRSIYAFIEEIPDGNLTLDGIQSTGHERIKLLGTDEEFNWRNRRDKLVIQIPKNINEIVEDSPTYVFEIPVLPYLDKPNVQISEHDGKAEITFISNDSTSELRYTFGNWVVRKGYEKKYSGPFTLNKSTMLNVQAFADGFLSSQVVTVPVNILDESHGLIRQTYEGQWENCDQMLDSDFVEEKTVFSLGLDAEKKNNFGHVFKGMIYIEKRGTYEFQTTSDDGSRLFINGFPVVDNDGLHGRKTISGDIVLKKGLQKFEMQYFERGGQESLDVKWKGSEFEWQEIPAFKFYTTIH